jgi:hypothetical protein
LMWNGSSGTPDYRGLHGSNVHLPSTSFSFTQQNPQPLPTPSNPVNEWYDIYAMHTNYYTAEIK